MSTVLRRTSLHERHAALGARLVPFAGWEMPIQYPAGVRAEHDAVRGSVGIFDVSHMGQVRTIGPGALAALQRLTTNDVSAIPVGGAQYGLLCREDGGILDDLFTYRLGEQDYLTVTNAANHAADLAWMQDHAEERDGDDPVEISDAADDFAMIAVQGPAARALVGRIADDELSARFRVGSANVAGVASLVCGTGYTGEDGVELLCAPDEAPRLWDALIDAGAAAVGLGARDTLRLEACYHLYGNDMDASRTPIEAGLGWACKEATNPIGGDAIARAREEVPAERLVPFSMTEGGIPRAGCEIAEGGTVTSGTFSPTLGRGVGLAYVPAARAAVGTELVIDVRGKHRPAVVEQRPLYQSKDLS